MKQIKLNFLLSYLNVISRCMLKNLIFSGIAGGWLLYAMCNGQVRNLEEANFTISILFKFSTNLSFWNHLKIQCTTEYNLEFSSLR